MAAASFLLAGSMATGLPLKRKLFDKYFLMAVVLFLLSLCVYPSAAVFYFSLMGLILLGPVDETFEKQKDRFLNYLMVGTLSMVIYNIILQVLKPYLSGFLPDAFRNPYQISFQWGDKLLWFAQVILIDTLNLWNIFPAVWIAVIIGSCILVPSLIKKSIRSKQAVLTVAAAGLVMLLSFAPNLLSTSNAPFYRCQAGISTLILIMFITGLRRLTSLLPVTLRTTIFTAILGLISLVAISLSYDTVLKYRVLPSHYEITYVKDIVKKADWNYYKNIYFVPVDRTRFKLRYDEFGGLTTFYDNSLAPLIICLFHELGKENILNQKNITILFNVPLEQLKNSPTTLIIDTNPLAELLKKF